MATSSYFNNYLSSDEQGLIEDLVVESIKIYGHDVFYCPRTTVANNNLYTEIDIADFNSAYMVEMYVKNVEGYEGEGEFLSKFNLEIRDNITLTVANRTFASEVGTPAKIERPREGDVIYVPVDKRHYVVKFVDKKPVFYQLGALQMYDLRCEFFEYSNERFNTGIRDIDAIQTLNAFDSSPFNIMIDSKTILVTETGAPIIREGYDLETRLPSSDNKEIQDLASQILDFSELDPFSEGGTY